MTKTIDTLIRDIYDTLEKGISVDTLEMRYALEDFSKDIMHAASDALQEGQRNGEARLRLSQIGKPDRQIWYGLQGKKARLLVGKQE